MTIDARSRAKLAGVHPDLIRVIDRAARSADFAVIEGVRSLERQKELKAKGASTTLRSRHLTGHAVDIAPVVDGKISWAWPAYYPLARAVKAAAKAEGVPIEWGGDWRSFKDGPHWQLPWKSYPATAPMPREVISDAPAGHATDREVAVRTASAVGGGSAVAAVLSDAADRIAPLAGLSNALTWVFAGLTIAGVAYGLWSWWRTRDLLPEAGE